MYTTAEQLPLNQNDEQFDNYARHWTDTTTWLAESLNGSMRTSFEYRFDGYELYAEDDGSMGEIFEGAVQAAHVIVERQPNLLFELRRRLIEHGEYQDMLAMARGDAANTMIVVSDFPPELIAATEDIGGYNTSRLQTMLRVISRQKDGSIRMTTQSLDGSNREALEAIYELLGETPQAGELLAQRIHKDLPESWQAHLIDNLTKTYDDSLARQHGGIWHAGIAQTNAKYRIDTYDFAQSQRDLVDWFTRAKVSDPDAAEHLRFKLAATVHERYERYIHEQQHTNVPLPLNQLAYIQNLDQETEAAAGRANITGKVFNGCGISKGSETSVVEDQLRESGYGNKSSENTKYSFDKKMHCVVCQAPPKKGETKKSCGPCGICRGCDRKLGGKG